MQRPDQSHSVQAGSPHLCRWRIRAWPASKSGQDLVGADRRVGILGIAGQRCSAAPLQSNIWGRPGWLEFHFKSLTNCAFGPRRWRPADLGGWPADPRWVVRPGSRGRTPDRPQDAAGQCFDTTGGSQENPQRRGPVMFLRQMRLLSKASFGGLTRRYDQEGRKAVVVPSVCPRVAISIVGGQLSRLVGQALCPAVVLKEESEPGRSASIAAVPVRTAAPARTGRG